MSVTYAFDNLEQLAQYFLDMAKRARVCADLSTSKDRSGYLSEAFVWESAASIVRNSTFKELRNTTLKE